MFVLSGGDARRRSSMEGTMANDAASVTPREALPPRGINHMVLNVRNLEVSHRFWTEIIGFRGVAELKPIPGRQRPKMRFYSGLDAKGDLTHHDLALAEVAESNGGRPRAVEPDAGQDWVEPRGDRLARSRVLAQAARVPAEQRCAVPQKGQSRNDPQRLHRGSRWPRHRGALRAASRGVGRRHRRRAELRGDASHGRCGLAGRPDGESRVRDSGAASRQSGLRPGEPDRLRPTGAWASRAIRRWPGP